jgi:hypothetical protein
MKTETKAFLISGIAIIAVSFILDIGIYRMLYNEYLNNLEKCSSYGTSILDEQLNQTEAKAKIDKLLELQRQNPAAYEDMQEQCRSNERTLTIYIDIISWIIFISIIVGITLVIVAVIMIINDRRRRKKTTKEGKIK